MTTRRPPTKLGNRIAMIMALVLGLALMFGGVFAYFNTHARPGDATSTGVIVDKGTTTCSVNGSKVGSTITCSYPIIEFTASNGSKYRANSHDAKGETQIIIGEKRPVAYDASNPNNNRVLDQSNWWIWLEAMGLVFIAGAYLVHRQTKKLFP